MKRALLALLFCVVFLQGHGIAATQQMPTKADFYISPTGNDNWSGALAAVNADHSDGPFATLQRARDAVRKQKRQQPDKDLLVLIRDGVYPQLSLFRPKKPCIGPLHGTG